MTRGIERIATAIMAATALTLPGAARAGNPDPESRTEAIATAFGQQLVCEGGPRSGLACEPFSSDDATSCLNLAGTPGVADGSCTGIVEVCTRARGVLTVIADTVLADPIGSNPYLETNPAIPCAGCEGIDGRSSYTMLLEFKRDGEAYVFAETYVGIDTGFVDVGNPSPAWSSGGFESELAADPETTPFKIRWGTLPPGVAPAVARALGDASKAPVVLQSNEVPVCTDAVECNNAGQPTQRANHAAANDVLASVRRFKVDLGFMGACAP